MAEQRILSIKELNRYIRMKLETDHVLQEVWIRGEISNFTHHSSGHMYFTLKDADSRIKAIMFASHNQKLPFIPKEGARVIARGNVSVYERDGQYQFYATHMQPDGIGSLYLAYEQLKKKLDGEGLFAPESKRPIPRFPRTIGVITSPTGAAVRDIIITLQRRHPAVPIILFPVLVQGKQAGPMIAGAIEAMNRYKEVDVLIVGRGGGSLEELWAFNEEVVARAIHASQIPIISAVGHETDYTIADFVADLRAATPTAAAELAVPHHAELKQHLRHLEQRMEQATRMRLRQRREALNRLQKSPVFANPRKALLQPAQRLDRLREQLRFRMESRQSRLAERRTNLSGRLLRHNPQEQATAAGKRMEHLQYRMLQSIQSMVKERKHHLISGMKQLDALSPLKVMARGFSLVYDEKERRLIKSIADVELGDLVRIKMGDGRLDCQVWGMTGEEETKDGGQYGKDGKRA